MSGIVEQIYNDPKIGYGYGVKIKHANNYRSIYGHLKNLPLVKVGDNVYQGQALGKMGTTGASSGTHLHFEVRDANDNAVKPEPMSGYTDFTVSKAYLSDNYIFPIGRYADGWHSDGTSLAFGKCCDEFRAFLGMPFDNSGIQCSVGYVHRVGIVWVQDFKQSDMSKPHFGTDGETCLILNETLKKVFLLNEMFRDRYFGVNGFNTFGAPKNNPYVNSVCNEADRTNYRITIRQDFEKGYMVLAGKDVYADTLNDNDTGNITTNASNSSSIGKVQILDGTNVLEFGSLADAVSYHIAMGDQIGGGVNNVFEENGVWKIVNTDKPLSKRQVVIAGKTYSYTPLGYRYFEGNTYASGFTEVMRLPNYNIYSSGFREISGEKYLEILKRDKPRLNLNDIARKFFDKFMV